MGSDSEPSSNQDGGSSTKRIKLSNSTNSTLVDRIRKKIEETKLYTDNALNEDVIETLCASVTPGPYLLQTSSRVSEPRRRSRRQNAERSEVDSPPLPAGNAELTRRVTLFIPREKLEALSLSDLHTSALFATLEHEELGADNRVYQADVIQKDAVNTRMKDVTSVEYEDLQGAEAAEGPSDNIAEPINQQSQIPMAPDAAISGMNDSLDEPDDLSPTEDMESLEDQGPIRAIEEEDPSFGDDYCIIDGEHIHITHYLGVEFDALIRSIYETKTMETPPKFLRTPHAWQLVGAAQAHALCKGGFRGCIVGDQMGLGKTLLAILAMELARQEPGDGFSLVVCPKSCQIQWIGEIENSYEADIRPKVLKLDDSSMTAHQLLHGGYDIVLVSYESLESSYRGLRDFPEKIAAYKAQGGKPPKRPHFALFSDLWKTINMPIKRLVLDEVQRVKNATGARHMAVAALFFEAVLLLSGTFLDNHWYDVGGLIQFLRGHPFTNIKVFRTVFSDRDYQGAELVRAHKIHLLQKFLMAFVIARPSSLLHLRGITRYYVLFNLNEADADNVEEATQKYEKATREQARDRHKQVRESAEGSKKNKDNPLGHAVRAQLYSLHSDLVRGIPDSGSDSENDDENENEDQLLRRPDDDYDGNEALDGAHGRNAARVINYTNEHNQNYLETRVDMLLRLDGDEQLVFDSARVLVILRLYEKILNDWPGERIVIFSMFLKFLDILFYAFKKRHGFEAHRYDGSVGDVQREVVRKQFETGDPRIPMLITCGAGGVVINLTAASKLIQCELWWNNNIAWQAYCRIYRQGQEKLVHVFCLEGKNSMICKTVKKVAAKKTITNKRIQAALIRPHDQLPVIPEIIEDFGWARQEFRTDWAAPKGSKTDEAD